MRAGAAIFYLLFWRRSGGRVVTKIEEDASLEAERANEPPTCTISNRLQSSRYKERGSCICRLLEKNEG